MSGHSRRKSSKRRSKSIMSTEKEEDADDGSVFEVNTSQAMGRYMISKKSIKPGDIILCEYPVVVGPGTGCEKMQCIGCYKTFESNDYTKCNDCDWPLCSSKCKGLKTKFGHSAKECVILQRTNSAKFLNYTDVDEMRDNFNAIVPLRCLLLKETDPNSYELLRTMETHSDLRRNIPGLWMTNQISIVDRIRKDWGLSEFSEEEIHGLCGVLEINAFQIGHLGVNIRGLYPNAFLMSHDCVPNTNHIDDPNGFKLTVRASSKIQPGDMITLSYALTLQSTLKRREHLLDNKFFLCHCKRCSDPAELGTYLGALRCPKCKNGFVLSSNSLDAEAEWKCSSKKDCPGYTITARSMKLLIERITLEVECIEYSNDIEKLEGFLQKYRNVLHPNHYLNLAVKVSLSQLYGRIEGYIIEELSNSLLTRKQEICEELMKLFDIIEPGLTRLRGVTLYELHAPMMVLLRRQFSHCSKAELRSKLRAVLKCLDEASVILGYECEGSPEGVMGVAAKEASHKIKEWEKILGRL